MTHPAGCMCIPCNKTVSTSTAESKALKFLTLCGVASIVGFFVVGPAVLLTVPGLLTICGLSGLAVMLPWKSNKKS